jgi:hypothetical protein
MEQSITPFSTFLRKSLGTLFSPSGNSGGEAIGPPDFIAIKTQNSHVDNEHMMTDTTSSIASPQMGPNSATEGERFKLLARNWRRVASTHTLQVCTGSFKVSSVSLLPEGSAPD